MTGRKRTKWQTEKAANRLFGYCGQYRNFRQIDFSRKKKKWKNWKMNIIDTKMKMKLEKEKTKIHTHRYIQFTLCSTRARANIRSSFFYVGWPALQYFFSSFRDQKRCRRWRQNVHRSITCRLERSGKLSFLEFFGISRQSGRAPADTRNEEVKKNQNTATNMMMAYSVWFSFNNFRFYCFVSISISFAENENNINVAVVYAYTSGTYISIWFIFAHFRSEHWWK